METGFFANRSSFLKKFPYRRDNNAARKKIAGSRLREPAIFTRKTSYKNASTTAPKPRAKENPFMALLSQTPAIISASGRKR